MNIDNLKPLGAFIEHTVRPILDEFKWILEELDKREIKVTEHNIKSVLRSLMNGYVFYAVTNFIQAVTITIIVCLTALAILQA